MSFSDGDQEGSFVAIFVLLIIWWFTFIPKTFQSYGKTDEEGENVRQTRAYRANETARDGVLLLTVSTVQAFAGRADVGTITTLSWIFFAIWVVLIAISYFTEAKVLTTVLQVLGVALIFASLIVTYSTSLGRYYPLRGLA